MRRLTCLLLLCLAAPVFAALDLNTATVAELDALPGVGPSRAQAIVDYRSQHGPFASVDELRKVKGIGDKTFAELKPLLSVGAVVPASHGSETSPASAPSASPTAVPASAPAATGGFPWWIAGLVVVLAAAAFVFMRRRPSAPASAPQAPAAPELQAKPVSAPPPRPASTSSPQSAPPPRPAGAGPTGATSHSEASAPPARPAGAPPRPAGSAPAATAAAPAADTSSSAPPKPAGGPPKPAGSR